eukprot:sb/3468721/
MVDVRGTLGRGDDFRFPMYKKFGVTEVEDTIAFLKILKQKSYVDDARMAIWGWSYGGFVSAKVAGSGEKVVQAAISVAPVTTFRLYDNIYTERYMGLPQENPVYDSGDVLHPAANFKQTKYFLIHGTADDNVHYTNAAKLAFELVEHNVDFRMHAYTGERRGTGNSCNGEIHYDNDYLAVVGRNPDREGQKISSTLPGRTNDPTTSVHHDQELPLRFTQLDGYLHGQLYISVEIGRTRRCLFRRKENDIK